MHQCEVFGNIVCAILQRADMKQLYTRLHVYPTVFHTSRVTGTRSVNSNRIRIDFRNLAQRQMFGRMRLCRVMTGNRHDDRSLVGRISPKSQRGGNLGVKSLETGARESRHLLAAVIPVFIHPRLPSHPDNIEFTFSHITMHTISAQG